MQWAPSQMKKNKTRGHRTVHVSSNCAARDFTQLNALGAHLLYIQSLFSAVYGDSANQAVACLLWRPNFPYIRRKTATGKW